MTATTCHPTTTTKDPTSNNYHPNSAKSHPTCTKNLPISTTQNPTTTIQDPTITTQDPTSIINDPTITINGVRKQTCIEFLSLMKEFSESSCNAKEMVKRMDTLAHKDYQLFQLLPISRDVQLSNDSFDSSSLRKRSRTDIEDQDIVELQASGGGLGVEEDSVDTHSVEDWTSGDGLGVVEDKMEQMKRVDSLSTEEMKKAMEELRMNKVDEDEIQEWMNVDLELSHPSNNTMETVESMHSNKVERPLIHTKAVEERSTSTTDETDDTVVWGMVDHMYDQDLLSSIDHAVLCDRENRFLQWDIEMESPMSSPRPDAHYSRHSSSDTGILSPQSCGETGSISAPPTPTAPLFSRSPSNVDHTEDWNTVDFGTSQHRTISHILNSCLHKRKHHYPYKNQVTLINLSLSSPPYSGAKVFGGAESGGIHSPHMGGSLATSLAFGTQDPYNNDENGYYRPLLGASSNTRSTEKKTSSERRPKKRDSERRRMMNQKMAETFQELEGAFTEQDLDVKGLLEDVGNSGSMSTNGTSSKNTSGLSKLALSKLDSLPLPDLANLPQDLKELKRKIDATEHKVEGTKHRHRKGGPCPRCQVQNQLRAAKRAYHKKAVAHKKAFPSARLGESLSPEMEVNTGAFSSNIQDLEKNSSPQASSTPLEHNRLISSTLNQAIPSLAVASLSSFDTNDSPPRGRPGGGLEIETNDSTGSMDTGAPSMTPKLKQRRLSHDTTLSSSPNHSASSLRMRRPCGSPTFPSGNISTSSPTSSPSSGDSPPVRHVTVTSG